MTPDLQEQVEQHLATLESEDERREVRDLFRKVVEECCKISCRRCKVGKEILFRKGEGDAALGVVIGSFLATLCWAWIVAG